MSINIFGNIHFWYLFNLNKSDQEIWSLGREGHWKSFENFLEIIEELGTSSRPRNEKFGITKKYKNWCNNLRQLKSWQKSELGFCSKRFQGSCLEALPIIFFKKWPIACGSEIIKNASYHIWSCSGWCHRFNRNTKL